MRACRFPFQLAPFSFALHPSTMRKSKALSQCLDIQNLAYETAMGFKTLAPTDEAVERHARKCVALAQAARAWESAVERARILRGRGLPKSVEARNSANRRRRETWPEPMVRPVGLGG